MAYLRRLPSGRWSAVVRLPDGTRRSYTHQLRSAAAAWAADLEHDRRQGDLIDPRAGQVTVGQLWERVRRARRLESASRRRDESHWRNHVEPCWAEVPVGAILTPDVQTWVVDMETGGAGPATVQAAVGVLRAIMRHAVKARLIRGNPTAKGELELPDRTPHVDRLLGSYEDRPLLAALDVRAGGSPQGQLFAELLLYCGLRWSEAAALTRGRVDVRQRLLVVREVAEHDGQIRPYPKTRAGAREVPVPESLWPAVAARTLALPAGGLLVPGPAGGVLAYPNWRRRVWLPAVAAAQLDDPQPTPHDLRHTYGTRLAERGVPVRDIMAVMGHESLRAAQRYLHATDGRHDRVRQALRVHSGRGSNVGHEPGKQATSSDIQPYEIAGQAT